MQDINKIAVVDFGGQYAHLIARRIRQLNVFSEILDPESALSEFKHFKGIILSGGPASVYDKNAPQLDKKVLELGIPVLGICYGHQLIAKHLHGEVKRAKVQEYGIAVISCKKKSELFSTVPEKIKAWMSHGDYVCTLPEGFEAVCSTPECKIAGMADNGKKIYGIQFHPEVTHTPKGMQILSNFVYDICDCKKSWTMENFLKQKVEEIKDFVGNRNVFMLASGGVDSTVALSLLNKAIGPERIYALHIDSGFMRKNESSKVIESFKKNNLDVNLLDAKEKFISAVEFVYDPEEKRKIIGEMFVSLANEHLKNLNLESEKWLLGQGTIYPDTIETAATKHSSKIKTHHNRVESIRQMMDEGLIIEPISELYKDEVRELGEELGLPNTLVWRHPFPGPGLAIRILCSNKEGSFAEPELEELISEEASKQGYSSRLLPVKSVGVQGDSRSYRHAVALSGKLDWNKLEETSTKITNKFSEVNRVVYALNPNELKEIKLRKAFLTEDRISVLQDVDDLVMQEVRKKKLYKEIWQFPVVLLPLAVNGSEKEVIVLRPVSSREAMTAEFSRPEKEFVEQLAEKIMKSCKVSAVFYDVTHKPPATIEWE